VNKKTVRKDQAEREIYEFTKAAVGQYDIEVKKSQIGGKFSTLPRGEKIEADEREPLEPNIDAVRKVPFAV
jgi:hypothetical protein